jgi:vitamin B12 transporter
MRRRIFALTLTLALGAFKFESETGSAAYAGSPVTPIERGNYDYSLQFSGDVKNRLFYTAGTGLEDNGLFGFAGTPRASLAYYLFRPSSNGVFTGTKLHGSFGKGIKEPSVYQQQNSLFGLLSGISDGGSLLSQFNVAHLRCWSRPAVLQRTRPGRSHLLSRRVH